MGFLKKKSTATLNGEVSVSLTKMRPCSPAASTRSQSRPSSPFVASVVEEHRDDGGESHGIETDIEERSGKASAASSKAKKKSAISSGSSAGAGRSITSKSVKTRPTSNKTIESGKPAPATSPAKSPIKLGKKKKKTPEKKDKRMSHSQSRSAGRNASRGRERSNTRERSSSENKKASRKKVPRECSQKTTTTKKIGKAGENTPRKTKSISGTKLSRQLSPPSRRRSLKKRSQRKQLSDNEDSSYCSSDGSYSDDSLSSYSSGTEDVDESTFFTNGEEYESIGYNTTDGSIISRSVSEENESKKNKESGAASKTSRANPVQLFDEFMKKMEDFTAENEIHQLSVRVSTHGNVEKLELQEMGLIPEPTKPHDIVVKVECSTITLQDCMIRRGKWYEMQSLPFVPGSDFVGTIHAIGKEAAEFSTFKVGDRVTAVVPGGGNAKYITVPYQGIIQVPPEVDPVVALCLSSTYVPAREALNLGRKMNTPLTGANILIIGGNGPNGLAVIELALLEGANVFATADERHHEYLTKLGAKCFPIDPNKWLPTLKGKMDVVLDSVCLDSYESSGLALNPAGTLICTGMSAVYTQGQIRYGMLRDVRDYKAAYCRMRAKYLMKNSVTYDKMKRFESAPNEYAQHFRYLCHLASKDTITPLVSSRTPLNLVASTQKSIEHGDTMYGVCVCLPWETTKEATDSTKTEPENTAEP